MSNVQINTQKTIIGLNWHMATITAILLCVLGMPVPSSAQNQCSNLDANACAASSDCQLDLNADGTAYTCRAPMDRCEIGYRQHLPLTEVSQDNPQSRCEFRPGCTYQEAEQCYCPKIEGIMCVCDGGKPHSCLQGDTTALAPPVGDFTIVDLRVASEVMAGIPNPDLQNIIGEEIYLTEDSFGLSGMDCADWDISQTDLIPSYLDPNLQDVFVDHIHMAHTSGDHRILASWSYTCEGAETFQITQIDPRVILFHLENSSIHAIAELPMDKDTVLRMQKALKSVKYYSGEPDGLLDETTIRAASYWAEYRTNTAEQPLSFKRPALTMNLFDTMGVFE